MQVVLVWHCKTPRGWRRFPVVVEKSHGADVVRHGWVEDGGYLTQYSTGRYQLRSFRDGRQYFETLDTCHPRDAIRLWQQAKKRAAPAPGKPKNLGLLSKAADAYVKDRKDARKFEAAEHARLVLSEFLKVCTTPYVRNVGAEHVKNFHHMLRHRGLSERTISNKHERLRSFFRWLNIETPWMPDAPDYELSKPTVYTPAELTAIRKAVDGTLGIAIDMALMLGLREQELMYGEWQDVNFDHAEYHVRAKPAYKFMTKDKEQRLLPIPTVLLKRLKDHRKSQPEDTRLILATKANTPNTHLLRSLKRAARSAGLGCGACDGCKRETGEAECSHWTLHKFRRSCLTLMLRNGIDARTVQGFAGHSSLETTLRYLSPANTAEMQGKVNAIWSDPANPSRKTTRRRARMP